MAGGNGWEGDLLGCSRSEEVVEGFGAGSVFGVFLALFLAGAFSVVDCVGFNTDVRFWSGWSWFSFLGGPLKHTEVLVDAESVGGGK